MISFSKYSGDFNAVNYAFEFFNWIFLDCEKWSDLADCIFLFNYDKFLLMYSVLPICYAPITKARLFPLTLPSMGLELANLRKNLSSSG